MIVCVDPDFGDFYVVRTFVNGVYTTEHFREFELDAVQNYKPIRIEEKKK